MSSLVITPDLATESNLSHLSSKFTCDPVIPKNADFIFKL